MGGNRGQRNHSVLQASEYVTKGLVSPWRVTLQSQANSSCPFLQHYFGTCLCAPVINSTWNAVTTPPVQCFANKHPNCWFLLPLLPQLSSLTVICRSATQGWGPRLAQSDGRQPNPSHPWKFLSKLRGELGEARPSFPVYALASTYLPMLCGVSKALMHTVTVPSPAFHLLNMDSTLPPNFWRFLSLGSWVGKPPRLKRTLMI